MEQGNRADGRTEVLALLLSRVAGCRSGEGGEHGARVSALTRVLLERLPARERAAAAPRGARELCLAAALHDIGKAAVPESVLRKPGRLSREERALVESHTLRGAQFFDALPGGGDDPLWRSAREVCRWHHERCDGGGYPDGLRAAQIPLAAQLVALADVYDALTAARAYKPALSPARAHRMIVSGECGAFSARLLGCLDDCMGTLERLPLSAADWGRDPLLPASASHFALRGAGSGRAEQGYPGS